jgi:Prokaryotic Cytochrome C oxidase subunit IV
MTTAEVAIDRVGLKKAKRKGFVGAIWLAVLTLIEFGVYFALIHSDYRTIALIPFVLAKAWIILDIFMHIRALWGEDH